MEEKSYVIGHTIGEERFETILWAKHEARAAERVSKAFPHTTVRTVRESTAADVRRLA